MKKQILIIALVVLGSISLTKGQTANIEIKEKATPDSWSQIDRSIAFSNPNGATTDFYSKNGNKDVGIPSNYMGTQDAPDGSNYIGIITYYGDFARKNKDGEWISHGFDKWSEYAYAALPSALVAGKEYTVSFKVSLADKARFAVSGLGALLTSSPVMSTSSERLSQEPQITSSDVIKDKDNWTEIKGTFTAKGDEKYIAIGAFDKNYKVEYMETPYNLGWKRAYYYVSAIHVEGVAPKEVVRAVAPEVPRAPAPKEKPEIKEVKEEVKKVLAQALAGLQFESGKDVIKPSSYGVMDNVVKVMKENPTYNLSISGHTDNTGDAKKNKELSEKRAAAAAKYLSDRGISSSRLTTAGYGDTIPVADNKTSEGRAKNRRVEFKVTF